MEDTKEDKIGYKFFYKDFKGEINDIVVSVKTKDCELAIATFEHMYPNVTWRRFQLVGQEHSQIRLIEEPQIPLSEAFEFSEYCGDIFDYIGDGVWDAFNNDKMCIVKYTTSELYQLFLESKLKSND